MLKKLFGTERKIKIATLVVVAFFSMFVLSAIFCNPAVHSGTFAFIDEKKANAMMLTGTVTLASTAISALPEDTASSLANELADLAAPLMVIVCVLFLEKYLLTSLELIAFGVLLPLACCILIVDQIRRKKAYRILATKIVLIALVCALIVPVSVLIARMIEGTYSQTVDTTFDELGKLATAFTQTADGGKAGFLEGLTNGIGKLYDTAKDMLGLMIDGVAILLVTSCLMPLITVAAFVWCIKCIIHGHMENIEDIALSITNRLPVGKKNAISQEPPLE